MDYNIQDIYSLSPMQQGMLFHSLMDNKKTAYLEQLSCEINGNFDTDLFKKSWEVVIDRHSILRTAFVWEDVEKPLQVVMQSAPLAFQVLNWREYKDEEIKENYEKFLHDDLEKGFDFSEAPLMRITIISIKEDKLIFVWTHHHILFDGWGMQIILRDVFEVYESLINDRQFNLKLTRPYKDYIQWLEAQDINQAEDFWKRKLGDFYQPSLLSSSANRLDSDDNSLSVSYAYQKRTLGLELTKALNHFSKHYQLTLNTIIQGAWAMLIHFF
ncbi:MAG: condensation domain-containing protein, partial [Bacteroidota bacterium]|nr:condensation domain-containing protein [Bacteroidota bacterium]